MYVVLPWMVFLGFIEPNLLRRLLQTVLAGGFDLPRPPQQLDGLSFHLRGFIE